MTTSGLILIFVMAFLSAGVTSIMARIKGAKQSRWFAIYFGVAGAIFLVLGFLGLVARGFEGVTGAAVLGILFILFGVTCLMVSHLHRTISHLRDKSGD